MPGRYQNYGQPANAVVWGWKNFCRKEQMPNRDGPVCDDNEQSERPWLGQS
jgi:hypothetical protein